MRTDSFSKYQLFTDSHKAAKNIIVPNSNAHSLSYKYELGIDVFIGQRMKH